MHVGLVNHSGLRRVASVNLASEDMGIIVLSDGVPVGLLIGL